MNQLSLGRILVSVLATFLICKNVGAADRPNIVLIMGDDMGYTDIGCYGSEISTPHLDQLADHGVRFSQFYNTSRCCPTRAALLTGLYSHQVGIGLMTEDRGYEAYRGNLNRRGVTIAEALGQAGYRNYMSGKWHVTRFISPEGPKDNWPRQRGFDRFYGTIIGAGSFYDPTTLCRDNTYITPENDPEYQPGSFYYTDAISDNAVQFLTDHGNDHADEPFFMYVAYTSAHWPMHAPEEIVSRYKGKYDQGYQPIRQQRHKRAIEQGVLDERWELSPVVKNFEAAPHRDWEIRCMEVYAAMVEQMDAGIGKIINELDRQNILDNTIVIFLEDNGGCAEGFGRQSNADEREKFDFKPLGPAGLQPKIWPPMQTRDGRWVATGPGVMPGPADSYVAYGTGWANTSNTPFRGFKHDAYEGGISTPLIVHWPTGIKDSRNGAVVDDPAHLIDLMPTLLAAAGAEYPVTYSANAIEPMEGVSLLPVIAGRSLHRDQPLCFEHHGNQALRDGRWKIVSPYRNNRPREWELYDMVADRTELHDVSSQFPERKQKMIDQWQSWADRVGVQAWPFESLQARPEPDD